MSKLTLISGNGTVETSGLVTDRQCDPPDYCLFQGRDEAGREGWFLRLEVTGMFARRCGPFRTRAAAIKVLDIFASKVMEGFLDIWDHLNVPKQVLVMEGIPQLARQPSGRLVTEETSSNEG